MSRARIPLIVALFCLTAGAAFCSTIYVPDDFATIQGAISAAADGDTIIVRHGIYHENIDFLGKAVTLKSEKGPAATTIDGSQAGPVAIFQGGEGTGSILQGFFLTGGSAAEGAGILCLNGSSPQILKNVITENTASWGGGIYCSTSTAPVIKDNIISHNSALSGGGIGIWLADPEITNNIIIHNTATSGGGLNCEVSSPFITNNTITDNQATSNGGGIRCIHCFSQITNTIIWGNQATTGPEIDLDSTSDPIVAYCDVKGGWPGTYNIDADPLFVEAAIDDRHLTYTSPCRDRGDHYAPNIPERDFEGDLRDPCGIPDIGADEHRTHLYCMGDIVPGAPCSVRLTAVPNCTAWLVAGSGLLDPPYPTQYGDLYILPPFRQIPLGLVPSSGVIFFPAQVPSYWNSGESHYFQALVEFAPPLSYLYLSNLMALTVE